jgi:hypothetical protein
MRKRDWTCMMIKNDYCLEAFGENAAVLLAGMLL